MHLLWLIVMIVAGCLAGAQACATDTVDAGIWAEIQRIRVIDDHTHDDPVSAERGQSWRADLPLGRSTYPDVVPLRHDNPEWIRAWRALYGYRYSDMDARHLAGLLQSKRSTMKSHGNDWPVVVLDSAGVDIAFVNVAHLGPGQSGPRFRWVPFADPLLSPFSGSNSVLAYPGGPSSIEQLLGEGGFEGVPPTLREYVSRVIEVTLSRWAAAGAPAIKILAAYRRALDFESVAEAAAAPLYARGVAHGVLSAAEQKALEDYLFTEVSARAGAHGLVVQIHTGNGNGPYFDNSGSNPCLLEGAINSERLQKTKFVLLHGGWPYPLIAQAMTDKPNTYVEFSAETFYLTTHALAEVLRSWLGWHPEKVLFGTDAYSDENSPLSDYEEKQWLLTDKSRRALAIALTAMMKDGEISRARAIEIARGVLRENAAELYRIK